MKDLTDKQVSVLMSSLIDNAVPFVFKTFSERQYISDFGQEGIVSTPIGDVQFDFDQIEKLFDEKKLRVHLYGLIKPTLTKPLLILPTWDKQNNAKSITFIKTFFDKQKNTIYFANFTRDEKGTIKVVSSHDRRANQIIGFIKKGYKFKSFQEESVTSIQGLELAKSSQPLLVFVHIGIPFSVAKLQKSSQLQYLGGNYFVSEEWSFLNFKKLISQNINKFSIQRVNEFIEKLSTFKRIFEQIRTPLLRKNGFNESIIERYSPLVESKLFNAFVLKSELNDKEQLPRQTKMFSGLGLPFDSARKSNIHNQDGATYIRQERLSSKQLVAGRSCEISFTVSKVVDGTYAIIEASRLQPSHIGNMQNPLHFIPEAQPRNRAMSQSGYSTPKTIAANLRPSEIVEGATAYAGAPIINTRGEVIQGNGRAYTMKFYYSNYPKDNAGYKNWINKNGMYFGFTPKHIAKFANPIIVRMVDVSDTEAIKLGQFTQKDLEAVSSETTQIKSKVGLINNDTIDKIIDELLRTDTGEKTLPELIRDSNVLKLLINEGVIRNDDLETYTRAGVINETGTNFVVKLLLNLILKESNVNTSDVFISIPVSLQKSIEKSALYILKCRSEQSISKEVGNAVIGLRDYLIFKPNGNISNWKTQIDIFGNSVSSQYNDLEFKLIEIFADTPTQKQIVEYFKKYAVLANDEKGDMFSDGRPALSKKEAVKKVFGIDFIAEVKIKTSVMHTTKSEIEIPNSDTGRHYDNVVKYFGDKNIDYPKSSTYLDIVVLKSGDKYQFINKHLWEKGKKTKAIYKKQILSRTKALALEIELTLLEL